MYDCGPGSEKMPIGMGPSNERSDDVIVKEGQSGNLLRSLLKVKRSSPNLALTLTHWRQSS
jgi:hypothetical protein